MDKKACPAIIDNGLAEKLPHDFKTIYDLISQAILDTSVRYPNENMVKCWEAKKCGRTQCPSYGNANLRCWQMVGTFCGGKVQGTFAQKYGNCQLCEVFKAACKDEKSILGEQFNNMMFLLQKEKEKVNYLNKELLRVLDDLEKQHSHIQELTVTDSLTGAYNRYYLLNVLNREVERALAYNHAISLLMVDMDSFKKYNDQYGHIEGDDLLKIMTGILKKCVRSTDFVCRYGGDEFVIVLPETELTLALVVAERIKNNIEAYEIKKTAAEIKETITKTVSIGVATILSKEDRPNDLLSRADEAMYLAKKKGGNCVVCFGMDD